MMKRLYPIISGILILFSCTTLCKAQLVLNEIMANPNNGSLPAYEYIELFNNSNSPIQLSEITLAVNNNSKVLPSYLLAPQQYIILCPEQAYQAFERYGNVLTTQNWFTLTNTGATISLFKNAQLMDEVVYRNNWHSNTNKANGGWSLERINPNWTCGIRNNWSSSFSPNGGTPGRQNSVLDKKSIPELLITRSNLTKNTLKVTFNMDYQYIESLTLSDFSVDKSIGSPNQILWNNSLDTLTLSFNKDFQDDEIYTLQIKPVEICSQKIQIQDEILFKQSNIETNHVIISEILFNPKDGGVDFIEIFNTTDYPINLKDWQLSNRTITTNFLLIPPHEYLVITTNKSIITLHYPSAIANNIFQTQSIPNYPNQQGNVTIFSASGILIDSVYYNANMHDPLLTNVKGISLERQSTIHGNIMYNKWNSSSNLHENATPGYQNSTNTDNLFKKNKIFLTSKTVSPNNDLHEDLLEIVYQFDSPDYYLNLNIYNDKGTLINRLIRNQRAGSEGKITWDTSTENGLKAYSGHYIMVAEIHNQQGQKHRFKEAFIIVPNTLSY